MGGRLLQTEPVEVGGRVCQGQLVLVRPGREGTQQRLDGVRLAVQGQAQGMVGEQMGRLGPGARGLEMLDGIGDPRSPH